MTLDELVKSLRPQVNRDSITDGNGVRICYLWSQKIPAGCDLIEYVPDPDTVDEKGRPLYCRHCHAPKGGPHGRYCVTQCEKGAKEAWRTRPTKPYCTVCWNLLNSAGICETCYRMAVS